MSCKYCNLKRRKDGDVEWIAGEDWESESDDGGYICPHDNGFRMLVYYDARCACTAVDNIKYCPFCGGELTMPAEPFIKDERIRKAVRAWAEANDFEPDYEVEYYCNSFSLRSWQADIDFNNKIEGLEDCKRYTITELCGEEK